ncbi:MAG TPA: hypothetical protein VKA00_02680 [Trueperaceae bacterium]|nr:hypothetical protein [Trueperaceae bacterium]
MRQFRVGLSALAVVSVLILAACSGPVFDPTGTYTGTITGVAVTLTVTSTSAANAWDLTLGYPGGTYAGGCTHDPGGAANNLHCTFASGTGVLDGTLNGNTYSGTYTDTASPASSGTFSVTRP